MFAPWIDPDIETKRLRAMGHVDEKWPHIDIAENDIPQDAMFRDAWTIVEGNLTHDMEKAKDIWRDVLRQQRAPALAQLDVAYMKADEKGDATAKKTIAGQKQALRDITADPRINAANTIDELKKVVL